MCILLAYIKGLNWKGCIRMDRRLMEKKTESKVESKTTVLSVYMLQWKTEVTWKRITFMSN
jgi:hypothetical protein